LTNKQAPLLLTLILAAPAFAFADNIPGHSKSGNNYVAFSEGLTDQQDSQGNSARCNFLLSSIKENGSETSSFAKDEKGANLGTYLSTGVDSSAHPVTLVDFGANQGASSDKDKGKGKGKGKQGGGAGNENGTASASGAPSPLIAVVEPGSQTLLLFGLAGLGVLFYRPKTLTIAI
jgi:hypothetical protein